MHAVAQLTGVQAKTAIRFYLYLRKLIASKLPNYELDGEVEADVSYFDETPLQFSTFNFPFI